MDNKTIESRLDQLRDLYKNGPPENRKVLKLRARALKIALEKRRGTSTLFTT